MMYRLLLIAGLMTLLTGGVFAQDSQPSVDPELVAGNNAFAFDLYDQLASESETNLMYSPYSISLALAMTYSGARSETAVQISDVMHFLSQEELAPAFGTLSQELGTRAEPPATAETGDGLQLHVANALWGEKSITFAPEFLQGLADYAAPLNTVDFKNEPEPARATINDWVSEQTEDRINDLVPEGAITTDSRLVLTNAIYFNASWSVAFQPSATKDEDFTLLDGAAVTVPFMHQQEHLLYAASADYQAVELPYLGNEVAMLAIVPTDFAAFEESLDAERFNDIRESLGYSGDIALAMPRFEYETDVMLGDTLQDMGMELAFSDDADFSGITTDEPLKISEVIHKSFISVDESGTEAAAATAVIMAMGGAMPAEPITLRLDRPFLYVIYDRPTGTVLFVGRVLNPAG